MFFSIFWRFLLDFFCKKLYLQTKNIFLIGKEKFHDKKYIFFFLLFK